MWRLLVRYNDARFLEVDDTAAIFWVYFEERNNSPHQNLLHTDQTF
jgi:hypothetical protein